jgi:benzoate membrane transport protein
MKEQPRTSRIPRTRTFGALATPPVAFAAALIAALIGFGGTVTLIVQMGQRLGGTPGQITSTVTALCLGIGVAGAGLSFGLRLPIVLAWSTPGAALLATSAAGTTYPVAIGAFIVAAAMMIVLGLVPALGRLADRIPAAVAAAMLAGVLLPFCLALFRTFQTDWLLAGLLLAVYIVARQRFPTYALPLVLLAAIIVIATRDGVGMGVAGSPFGTLIPTAPTFGWQGLISLGIPLFLVTLASQNLPGFVVLRSAGYDPPPRPILVVTGLASLLLAPFGAHSVNLAAITAAICTGPEAHPQPAQRWRVGMIYAGLYLLLALFAAPLVGLFMALPTTTIAAITGIALLGPLLNALVGMLSVPDDREAAVLTFVTTASGVALLGIGAAFWGLLVGFVALGVRRVLGKRRVG